LLLTVCQGVDLDSRKYQESIIHTVKSNGIRVVALEPLRSLTAKSDQGPAEFSEVARFLRLLMRETGCSVWLGHHDVKPTRTGRDYKDLPQRASGGAIFGFSEAPLHFECIGEFPFRSRITPARYKMMDSPNPIAFTLEVNSNWGVRLKGETVDRSSRSDDLRSRILAFVGDNPDASSNAVVSGVGANRRETFTLLKSLAGMGVLKARPHKNSTLYSIQNGSDSNRF
jgi:hypothetical protein